MAGPLGLGTLELSVMQFVWQQEEAGKKATTVRDAFTDFYPKRKLAYTTVMTAFRRLDKKGWLSRLPSTSKVTYFYQSARSRREVGEKMLDWVATEFFDGELTSDLVKEESGI